MALTGCDNDGQSGGSNEIVFYGRAPQAFEVCFYVGDDLATLTPNTICDREEETAYSFNIEATGGIDQDGEVCAPFAIPYEEPIPIEDDGTFAVGDPEVDGGMPFPIPGQDGEVYFNGTIDFADGVADGNATITFSDESNCSFIWTAGTGPVCREEEEAQCALLLDCCESILLVPPILADCMDVVNDCDTVACLNVLAGYTQCAQPPICPVDVDRRGACELLDSCCNTIDLSKPDLEACLDTAEACQPVACDSLLETYPSCPQLPPICTVQEDPAGDCELLEDCCNTDVSEADREACLDTAEACEPAACVNLLVTYPRCSQPVPPATPSVAAQ